MTWLKANWKKILLGIVIIAALAAAYIYWPVHEEIPLLRYTAHDVNILCGTPYVSHIFGHTDADATYGDLQDDGRLVCVDGHLG